ncbi:acyl carrier protein [Endomicrobium proavitum]|uniref:Acyl carrier protein n=1 Tax=Endomicrobium proavitum TaxID=1408281 RepID=A0A0G3WKC2_9BACT|nr:phosphopantetheine-binding protein [Endomicrobium proavitum]AKL98327.1 acyl carrier protein [Endomicrobium proavitum]
MIKEEIIRKVNDALIKEFELDPAVMKPDANFFADLGLDSLDAVDMVVVLEQAFKVKMRTNYEIGKIITLNDLYNYIEGLMKKNV